MTELQTNGFPSQVCQNQVDKSEGSGHVQVIEPANARKKDKTEPSILGFVLSLSSPKVRV